VRALIVCAGMAIAFTACASPGTPPGGPVDTVAPRLLAVSPESGAVRTAPRAVIFRFDEVVSERPIGVAGLANLFLISPQEGTPVVDWSRSEVSVRPRRGWRPNTTYTVTLLPGITDLRGNASTEQHVMVFSTGAEIPQTRITGTAWDWVAAAPARGALVQAITPDSLVYATAADTTGEFTLAYLPVGQYLLQAFIDDNRNRALDPRERFDTTTVVLRDTVSRDFFAAVRDSVPPRITAVSVLDSVTLQVAFDVPLAAEQDIARFTVLGADTLTALDYDPAPPDTVRTPMPIPPPPRAVRVTVPPMRPDATYVVRADGVRSLAGVTGPSERQIRTPASFQRDTNAVRPPAGQ
jgi:hypothetical protein